uniref:RHS repeat-associated core domain-containing protein n=1 Tax=Chitinilyticum litopenaei TaxID=1121276 RepID=UPI0011863B33
YNTFRYYDPESGRYLTPDPIGLAGGLHLYGYVPDPNGWMDPWGWVCIPNKKAGTAREERARGILEKRYGKDNVVSERYLRDAKGKSVKDPLTGERRRVDFMVKKSDGKWHPYEVTSKTAPKDVQISKEIRIIESGGTFFKNPTTGRIEAVEGLSTIIRAK